ncbi:3-hydroxy-3-methylglutaryl-coenzyme A (HMG-CoA) reductase isozyme, partial [Spiromyces aspiralis]
MFLDLQIVGTTIRVASRRPFETIIACAVIVALACSALWRSIRYNDVFLTSNTDLPHRSISYVSSSFRPESLEPLSPSLRKAFSNDILGEHYRIFSVVIADPQAFSSSGILRADPARRIQKVHRDIPNMPVLIDGHDGSSVIRLRDVCAISSSSSSSDSIAIADRANDASNPLPTTDNPIATSHPCLSFSPIRDDVNIASSIPIDEAVDESMVYLTQNPRRGIHGHIMGAKSVILSYVLNVTSPSQLFLANRWEQGITEQLESLFDRAQAMGAVERWVADLSTNAWAVSVLFKLTWRTYDLIQEANAVQVLLELVSYTLTLFTFINVLSGMKKCGSRITLAFSIILSGFFAFAMCLFVTHCFGITINSVLLAETLPLLITCVGFDKALNLTRTVISEAASGCSSSSTSSPDVAADDSGDDNAAA